MEKKTGKKLMRHFGAGLFLFLVGAAMTVFLTDPFFHYHKPWFGLSAVQDAHQYQVPGALRNLAYDSILVGSSVSMSMNTNALDAKFGTKTIKAVENSAPAAILKYYIESALENRELKNVYYGMDIFSFYCSPGKAAEGAGETEYLTNKNPFDDIKYLWNGEIILERVPDLLKISRAGIYDEGLAYQFNTHADCGPEAVLADYDPNKSFIEPGQYEEWWKQENLDGLENLVKENSETEFIFFIPAYSVLWWYAADNVQMFDDYMEMMRLCMQTLLPYENVKMYAANFNTSPVITDLHMYMDPIHGGRAVTELMVNGIGEETQEITLDNYEEQVEKLVMVVGRFKEKYENGETEFLYLQGGMQM